MKRIFGPMGRLAILTLSLAFFAGMQSASARGDDPRALAPPDETGPWAVGRLTFDVVDAARGDRPLTVDAWYPVDPDDAIGRPSVYDLVFAGVTSEIALSGVPVAASRAFPLVVFSHGNFSIRFQSWFLAEALASHGFIVVAPDHTGNTAGDLLFGTDVPFEQAVLDRPADISFVIDQMLEKNALPGDEFEGRIDAQRIGVTGHSLGGFTTLAMASGFESNTIDPRVLALLPISPASGVLTDEALGLIGVPTMIIGGSADITTPVEPESARPFELIPARPRYRVDLIDAGHNSFTNICEISDALLDVGLPPDFIDFLLGNVDEGCAPELIPIAEAQRVTQLFAVAYLQYFIAGEARYRSFLSGRYVADNDIPVEFSKVRGLIGP